MIIFYCVLSLLISWIWIDYFRLIDVFEKENIKNIIPAFLIGAVSISIVYGIDEYILVYSNLDYNGAFLNDLIYSILHVGLVVEVVKIIPFYIVYRLFKKEFNEPVDYLVYICTTALGFAAIENVLHFMSGNLYTINEQAILSTISHLFNAALVAYGIIQYKFSPSKVSDSILVKYIIFAILSHSVFNFIQFYFTSFESYIVIVTYFLFTISFFASILNNALNNSPHFSYKHVINSDLVAKRLLLYYGILFGLEVVAISIIKGSVLAGGIMIPFMIFKSGIILGITILRLSRFKLIKDRWNPLVFELPFSLGVTEDELGYTRYNIEVKGNSYNEMYINTYYQTDCLLKFIGKRKNLALSAYVIDKYFTVNDKPFYEIERNDSENKDQTLVLFPKESGEKFISGKSGKHPIAGLMTLQNGKAIGDDLTIKDFKFNAWVVIKPVKKTS